MIRKPLCSLLFSLLPFTFYLLLFPFPSLSAQQSDEAIIAAYSNPAGLAFLQHEGFSLSLNNQSAFQTRTITTDFAPFAGLGGNTVKEFEGKATAWIIPNIQAAYKTGRWILFK